MKIIQQRYTAMTKTLKNLERALRLLKDPKCQEIYDTMRNSTIRGFKYSIDTFHRYSKSYLQEIKNIDIYPTTEQKTLEASLNANLIDKKEYLLLSFGLKHRDATSFTHDKYLVKKIMDYIPTYCGTMKKIVNRLDKTIEQ